MAARRAEVDEGDISNVEEGVGNSPFPHTDLHLGCCASTTVVTTAQKVHLSISSLICL